MTQPKRWTSEAPLGPAGKQLHMARRFPGTKAGPPSLVCQTHT
ncbi:hypothetical protein SAMN04515673_103313 [Poseidonocella sedimentorum]|uniref:Uncharacterized protein n=1 Tax=Poseidonocella sedimentorum TaxID=871652 RepID=A0A1I6DI95_9RHOB|nr:hypothetical protein SAMN04515673_103313 [Poseidonocella sedimentorum]